MATMSQTMQDTLAKVALPSKRIHCYGSQIVITSHCRDTAEKWANVLGKFAKVRGIVEAWDEAVVNRNTVLKPTMVKVWRTFAVVGAR